MVGVSVMCLPLLSLHSKKPSDLRYHELLEGVKGPLLQLATRKAGLWAQSKPHAPLLVQVATILAGEFKLSLQ